MTSRPTLLAGGVPGRRVSFATSCTGICVVGSASQRSWSASSTIRRLVMPPPHESHHLLAEVITPITPRSRLCRGGGGCRWWVACSGWLGRHNHGGLTLVSPTFGEAGDHGCCGRGPYGGPVGALRAGVRCRVGAGGLHAVVGARPAGPGCASEPLAGR